MKEITELKEIISSQKTVTTKKLKPLVEAIGKAYSDQGKRINAQREVLSQHEALKADNRRLYMELQKLRGNIVE